MSGITVEIAGAKDSEAAYDDEDFIQTDQRAYDAIIALYEAGAKVENVAECVQRALGDAGAAE